MLHDGMLFTFIGTCLTDVGTQRTELFRVFAAPAHEVHCGKADDGTVAVQLNALSEHGHILLVETRSSTVVALYGTVATFVNAESVFLVGHDLEL